MKTFKTTILSAIMLIAFISTAQKKNGTVYLEHPAIDVVNDFVKASVAGDKAKMADFLTEDFIAYNGTSNNLSTKGSNKEAFLNTAMMYFDRLDYYKIESLPGSYPDAIEYKKDNTNNEITVQTWDVLKGVDKQTGVKIDAAGHRLYTLTKDNKIKMIISYSNSSVIDEIRNSFSKRRNGIIYNNHENINTVRKMMYALEKNDWDKMYSFYDTDAIFINSSSPTMESRSLIEQKVADKKINELYEIVSIDMVGYPDYLEYEMGNLGLVQSWWNINLVRKADKKKIVLPIFYTMEFNDEGKINAETAYVNAKLLD